MASPSAPDPGSPAAAGALAVLYPAFDPWQGQDEILLFEGRSPLFTCVVFPDNWYPVPRNHREACARGFRFPSGVLVPQGTGRLRIELDLSQGRGSGPVVAEIFAYDNSMIRTENATGDRAAWDVPLSPAQWDLTGTGQKDSGFSIVFRKAGDRVLLEDAPVRVSALRDPSWQAEAYGDPWKAGSTESVPGPGFRPLFDTEVRWKQPGGVRHFLGDPLMDSLALRSPIVLGTQQLAVVVAWKDVSGCLPHDRCFVRPIVWSAGGGWISTFDLRPRDESPHHVVYVFNVSLDLRADGPHAARSAAGLYPGFGSCTTANLLCGSTAEAPIEASVRVRVEAWDREVVVPDVLRRTGL